MQGYPYINSDFAKLCRLFIRIFLSVCQFIFVLNQVSRMWSYFSSFWQLSPPQYSNPYFYLSIISSVTGLLIRFHHDERPLNTFIVIVLITAIINCFYILRQRYLFFLIFIIFLLEPLNHSFILFLLTHLTSKLINCLSHSLYHYKSVSLLIHSVDSYYLNLLLRSLLGYFIFFNFYFFSLAIFFVSPVIL